MARTKQVAFRGKRRAHLGPSTQTFLDHAQKPYSAVGGRMDSMNPSIIRKLSIHVYFLGDLDADQREEIGMRLLRSEAIAGWGNARNYWPRIDVYTPLGTVEECIEHHRREKIYRCQATEKMHEAAAAAARDACGPEPDDEDREEAAREAVLALRGKEVLPHIVPTWCCSAKFWQPYDQTRRYRSFILVVPADCRSWDDVVQKGIIHVMFDQDWSPAMETEMYTGLFGEESLLENDLTEWVVVENVERDPPVRIERVSVVDDTNELEFYSRWVDYTGALWDCTYRIPSCDACDDDRPHENCGYELDDHYFDEDGQCIACRRHEECRRRSKRIAKKRKREDTADGIGVNR